MWVALIMGIITGAFGGVLRDILINEEPLIFHKDIYATACLAPPPMAVTRPMIYAPNQSKFLAAARRIPLIAHAIVPITSRTNEIVMSKIALSN